MPKDSTIHSADSVIRDWKQNINDEYTERQQILNEIHKRGFFPLEARTRATVLSYIFPSDEDVYRLEIAKAGRKKAPIKYKLCKGIKRRLYSMFTRTDCSPETEKPALTKINLIRQAIREIPKNEDTKKRYPNFELKKNITTYFGIGHKKAIENFSKLCALCNLLNGKLFDPSTSTLSSEMQDFDLRNGNTRRLWINWPKGDLPSDFKIEWELYSHNQNFIFLETFADNTHTSAPNFKDSTSLKPAASRFVESLNSDNIRKKIKNDPKFNQFEPFAFCGELLVAAHYWICPGTDLIDWWNQQHSQGEEEMLDQEYWSHPQIFSKKDIRKFRKYKQSGGGSTPQKTIMLCAMNKKIKEYYQLTDAMTGKSREDFVFCAVAEGRAFMACDMRPAEELKGVESADKTVPDYGRGTRSLIFDFSLSHEQRGRLLNRLMRQATFRLLALRGYPYMEAIDDTLNALALKVTQCGQEIEDISDTSNNSRLPDKEKVIQLTVVTQALTLLSSQLAHINHFLTHGVVGRQLSGRTYKRGVEARLKQLKEYRVPKHQTLSEFLRRFSASAANIERIGERYETIRRRITQSLELVETNIQMLQTNHQGKIARFGLLLFLTTIALQILALFLSDNVLTARKFLANALKWIFNCMVF